MSKAGPSFEVQKAALESAGITDFSEIGPVYVDLIPKKRSGEGLPSRANAIKSLLPGQELVVSSADRLGTSVNDVLDTLQRIANVDALIYDVELGEQISWHPDATKAVVYAQRADTANRKLIAVKMRQKRAESGRLGGRPGSPGKTTDKRARELWADMAFSAAEVAEKVGVSVPTLYRRYGDRGVGVGKYRRKTSSN